MVYNPRVSIVHDDRLSGYVLRSWSGTEKVEAVSRQTLNSGSGEIVSTLYLGRSGARAHALQVLHVEKRAIQLRYAPSELVIAVIHVLTIIRRYSITTGRAVQLYLSDIGTPVEHQGQVSHDIQSCTTVHLDAGT